MNHDVNCEQIKPGLLEYLMEEAPAPQRKEVETHLKGCDSCAKEMAALQETLSLVRRAEVSEEIPRKIRLLAEPAPSSASPWMAFWRNPARLAFGASGLLCIAIAALALFHTTVAYQNGNFQIAFGVPAVSSGTPLTGSRPAPETPASSAGRALSEEQVAALVAKAVAANEAAQQQKSELTVETASNRMEQRWKQDLREMSESMRYFQAAQNVLWKDQVQNQQLVSALVQRSGTASPMQQ